MRPAVKASSGRISSPEIAGRFRTLIVQAAKPGSVVFTGRMEGRGDRGNGQELVIFLSSAYWYQIRQV